MESSDFKKWRKSLGLSQKDAAHLLGLKRRMIQYYEKGERDGDKVKFRVQCGLPAMRYLKGLRIITVRTARFTCWKKQTTNP
ncbi:helix-turn-helix domain-containing protein [Hyphococcus aureus]|uniref:Helix-turn-helix domain-containing protein n=1 Tax=Hyphococcus aureus TaxID=2666033 RepID=A0ABW1KX60_9PROT